MLLAYLPEEMSTDLDSEGFPGAVAFWRPMDLLDKAMWADNCRKNKVSMTGITAYYYEVKQQLLRIEGLKIQEAARDKNGAEIKDGDGKLKLVEVDFDVSKHLNRLGLAAMIAIGKDIDLRANMSEIDIKNFAGPYVSEEEKSTAISDAESAVKGQETASGA